MKQGVVCILKCSDGSLYTGVTSQLKNRLAYHYSGRYPGYPKKRRPVQLVWSTDVMQIRYAILLENQIKHRSRRQKLALIHEEWEQLHELSKCKNASSYENMFLDFLFESLRVTSRDDEGSNSAPGDTRKSTCL